MDAKLKLLLALVIAMLATLHFHPEGRAADSGEMRMINEGYIPSEGFVPDESTAKLLVFAILAKIYGSKQISSEQPFRATLKNEVWTVEGSLPKDMAGGVATIKLSKSDARVLYVYHEK